MRHRHETQQIARGPAAQVSDLPTGATIVCTFGLVLIIMALLRPLIGRDRSCAASRAALAAQPDSSDGDESRPHY
jgi:hypothetical protein